MSDVNANAIAYAASRGWGPSRTLAAIGHPGYGAAFSRRVLAIMAERGCDAFAAIELAYAGLR